tara:strand:- start:187 stop:696 length:510 start_codon:yes stop_codon:yes gene_type:complete
MRLFTILFFCAPLVLFSQESSKDSTLVSQNANKIDELKRMIRSSVEKEDELKSLKGELSAANARILVLEQTLDSLLSSLKPKTSDLSGSFYIVVEAQKSQARGSLALNQLKDQLKDELKLVQSESGNWFFVVLSESPKDDRLIDKLDKTRGIIPDAWFVERTKTQQMSN